ncbi:MAG: hypothetical protein ACRBCJ_03860 [Hyphomicrobiaceae bacterium]
MAKVIKTFVSVLVAIGTFFGPAIAQDFAPAPAAGFWEYYPPRVAARITSYNKTMQAAGLVGPEASKGVFASPLVWPPSIKKINVCFFNGHRAFHQLIAMTALEWTIGNVLIPLDFGDLNQPRACSENEFSHIRVSLNDKGQNYSAVGILSYKSFAQTEESMSISVVNPNTKKLVNAIDLRRAVLHEFGHALGLAHEHQSPFGKCEEEYNWKYIYRDSAKPPLKWSKKVVDHNMRQLNRPGTFASEFDKDSIMLYTFPEQFFKAGKNSSCFSEENYSISKVDRDVIAELYPADQKRRYTLYEERRKHLLETAKNSKAADNSKSAALQLLNDFLPEIK